MVAKRNTLQRQIILDTIKSTKTHPSAEELYFEVQKSYSAIGKSTVYRHLRELLNENIIAQLTVDGVTRYDKNAEFHCHLICEKCGKIFDIEMDIVSGADEVIMEKYGFSVNRREVEFFGACTDCK